jgi:hypothetical protein
MLHSRAQALLLGVMLASPGWAGEGDGCGAAPCAGCVAPSCCAPAVCKTCVPAPDVIKIVTPAYTCKGADICLPKRSLCDLFTWRCDKPGCGESCGGCASGCGSPCDCVCPRTSCPQCECRARHKMVLMKKLVTTECPAFKCEPVCCPETCPGCGSGCFDAPPMPEQPAIPPGEAAPPKKPTPSASRPRRAEKAR